MSYPVRWRRSELTALGAGLKKLFMGHPPLEERVAALRRY